MSGRTVDDYAAPLFLAWQLTNRCRDEQGAGDQVCLDVLQAHLRSEKTSENYTDYLAYNDKWEAELQAYSLQEAIEHFETAHYHLFGFLSTLAPEGWNGYVRTWVQGSTWHHFEEHAEQIRAWRASRPQ